MVKAQRRALDLKKRLVEGKEHIKLSEKNIKLVTAKLKELGLKANDIPAISEINGIIPKLLKNIEKGKKSNDKLAKLLKF